MDTKQSGQSLIEVLVVGVVSAIMIIALIAIILNSLKNAQFAQNQTQATKYAQDTIDRIRILRDNNKESTINDDGTYYCFNKLWGGVGDPLYCGAGGYCYYSLNNTGTVLNKVTLASSVVSLTGSFLRQIKVTQPFPNEVAVTAIISWSDSSGDHNSTLETIITKPNYDCIL
ncbi:MAG: prepilin-type N-terminal cleavage/methylation domain-containing protein [Candidatus Daviesbacteria bacterium]|nr:prepilin-type N-terminal cleavage/methylation domain-containing protein [Candidatus Daviesbacteria bacterium]